VVVQWPHMRDLWEQYRGDQPDVFWKIVSTYLPCLAWMVEWDSRVTYTPSSKSKTRETLDLLELSVSSAGSRLS
jgi:hypothetical protein